ncbi:FAD-binding oxidoreductase [Microlunatus ginsengisoli]|uniref:FAD-binding oxidoreductase n=2 Tax=Microlunatus ginsengisoli TaxID=363863 RepID=A0ABP7AC68_9ACTN
MTNASPNKIAVVGGGILGVSTAQQLARAGATVVLVTDREPTSNASGRSLSWLNSAGVRGEAYHRLRMAGIDRYRTLFAQHPDADWLRFDGGLAWQPEDQDDQLRRHHEHERSQGYDSHLVTREQIANTVPGVDPAAAPPAGAIWNPGEGWVDLPSLSQVLIKDFLENGGQLVTNAGPASIEISDGSVTRVRTEHGEVFDVDAVVLATGPAVPAMAAKLGVIIPDATPISLLVTTKPIQHRLKAVLNTPRASVRPTPDGALAVDSDWTTASIIRSDDGGYDVDQAVIEALLAEASKLLAGNPNLEADWHAAGPKPIPGDGEPVLGRVDEVDGLYLAFTHSGATLALITGELLTHEVLRGPHPMLADFNVRRFR